MRFQQLVEQELVNQKQNSFDNLLVLRERAKSESQSTIDKVQTALDVIGFDPTIGNAADAINTLISAFRAALSKEFDERKKHIINTGISAISLIPFADVLKLLKLRKNKHAFKGAHAIKHYGKSQQSNNRFKVEEANATGGISSVFGSGVTSTSTAYSGDTYAPGDARTPKLLYKGALTRFGNSGHKKKKKKVKWT